MKFGKDGEGKRGGQRRPPGKAAATTAKASVATTSGLVGEGAAIAHRQECLCHVECGCWSRGWCGLHVIR